MSDRLSDAHTWLTQPQEKPKTLNTEQEAWARAQLRWEECLRMSDTAGTLQGRATAATVAAAAHTVSLCHHAMLVFTSVIVQPRVFVLVHPAK
jgi:hypothetical protein